GKSDQRDHREGQLETKNHLTEDEQRSDFVFAGKTNDQSGRNDGDRTSDEPAEPGLETNVQEAFHHDLAGQRAGKRRILSGGEQRASKERARQARSKHGAEKFVGVGDFRHVVKAATMKSRSPKNQNRGIDK